MMCEDKRKEEEEENKTGGNEEKASKLKESCAVHSAHCKIPFMCRHCGIRANLREKSMTIANGFKSNAHFSSTLKIWSQI